MTGHQPRNTVNDEPEQQAEPAGEKWIRIHPDDRLWLEEEILRLQQERYEATRVLQRPSLQDTVASVFSEVKTARTRLGELEDELAGLRDQLDSCPVHDYEAGDPRDAHPGHQPGPGAAATEQDAGQPCEASTL